MASKRPLDNDFARSCFFKCSPCFRKNSNSVQAVKFCEDCLEYLCSGCVHDHNKFSLLTGHTLLNNDEMRSFRSKPCKEHPREMIDRYCDYHAVVFCPDCESKYHRSCTRLNVIYLPTAAKRTKTSDEYSRLVLSMQHIKLQLEQTKKANVKELERLQQDKYTTMCEIQDFTNKMIKQLTDLEQALLGELYSKYKEYEDKINENMETADKSIISVEEIIKEIETHDRDTEEGLFLCIKNNEVTEENYRKQLKSIQEIGKKFIKFKVNNATNKTILGLNSLGQLKAEYRPWNYTLSHHGDYSMKIDNDVEKCSIEALCQLNDGTIVVADINNEKLKRLDEQYKVRDHCVLPSKFWGMCVVETDELAVALFKSKVQFVTIGRTIMTLSRSISVEQQCYGVGYMMEQLFVSCDNEVIVYNKFDEKVKTIEHDMSRRQMFKDARQIAFSSNNTMIHVADMARGVVSFDVHGQSHFVFTNSSLKDALSLCVGPDDQLFVAGKSSHNILRISNGGITYEVLLSKKDGISRPQSVCYDKVKSRLVVGMDFNDTIKVYNLLTN